MMIRFFHFQLLTLALLRLICTSPSFASFLQADPQHVNTNVYEAFNSSPDITVDRTGQEGEHWNDDILIENLHPKPPKNIVLEQSSAESMKMMEEGNAMVGIVDVKTGIAYLNPVTRRFNKYDAWHGNHFAGQAKLLGKEVEPIEHMVEGLQAHKQLVMRVDELLERPHDFSNYVGFGINYRTIEYGGDIEVLDRSRSLNGNKFFDWKGAGRKNESGDMNQVFEKYHKSVQEGLHPNLAKGAQSVPHINELTQPNLNGRANYKWRNKIFRAIDRQLPDHLVDRLRPTMY